MSKYKLYTILIVSFILLTGLSAISANDNITADNSSPDDYIASTNSKVASGDVIEDTKSSNINDKQLKQESKNIKQRPGEKIALTMEADDVVCNWGEIATLNSSLYTTDTHEQVYPTEGVVMTFVDNDIISTHNLSHASMETYYDTTQLDPGVYDLYYQYTASLVYESTESYNTITINHQYNITTQTNNIDYSYTDGTFTPLTLECSDYYGYGDIDVYIDDELVDSITDVDYDAYTVSFDESMIDPLAKKTYNWKLIFKPYLDILQVNNLEGTITSKDYPLSISTPDDTITADVGDIITIAFSFNDTVNDGNVSISYGSSIDNTTAISSGNNYINFNTTGYMQGEYELELAYHDSNTYKDTSTTLTLYLYQPTTITADKDEINVVLGKDNTYTVEFETSLDAWDEVIWGSIDVYIDDEIIDTLVVDDESTNTLSFILDDYNMESLEPGTHTLKAVFTSDDEYITQSSTTVTLTVSGDLTIELPSNITTNTTSSITVPANVTFNNQPVTSGMLSYYINGSPAGTLDLSQASTKTLENNYDPGVYTLSVEYNDPSNTYPEQSNTTTLYITSNTSIQTAILNDTIRNTTINIKLTDDKNNNFEGYVNITLPNGSVMENIYIPSNGLNLTFDDLANGSNTFTINYSGNEVYTANTETITVDVVLLNSTTTATITNNTIDNTTISIMVTDEKTGTPVNGGQVEVVNTANNLTVATATLSTDGTAIITTNINAEGTYTLQVNYKGNNQYNTSSTTINDITVVKRESMLDTEVNNNTLGNTTITITLHDPATDTPIANQPITVTLPDESTINTHTDSNGQTTVDLNIPVGENTIKVDYPGNDKYTPTNEEITINTVQRPSMITATITNNTIQNTTINATVYDKTTGSPVTSGDVVVIDTSNNQIIATGTLNGNNTITLTTTIDTSGEYNLRVEYNGNTNYTPASTTLEDVKVTKRESRLNVTINNATQNDTQINITLRDPATDTPIPNQPITVTLPNGTTIEATTDENGTIIITPDLPVGENNITITYPGDDTYNTTTINHTINITQRQSLTTARLDNNTIQNTTISVTVRDKLTGQKITSGNITITNTDNNEIIARGTLNGTNTINIPLNINTAGQYNLRIDYHGNTNYTPSNTTLNDVTITKRNATIDINTINNTIDDTRINITVKDPVTNTSIANAPITITLPDGTKINTHTGSTGTTTITLDLPSDTQTINITYDGSNTYQPSSKEYTLNVEKLPTTITVNKQTGYIGENLTLTAQVTDAQGNPITGGRVIFKLNGITLKYEDNETIYADVTNGIATTSYYIPTSYQAKTYKLEAVYTGSNTYNSSRSNTPLVNLKQRQAQLTINTNTSVKVDQTLNIQVNITDKRDPTRTVNGYIILKIDGLTLKDTNGDTIQIKITNNQASYNYTIGHQYSARKHTITAVLINDTYVRSQANQTFNVTQTTANIQLNTPRLNNNRVQLTGQITDEAGHTLTGQNTALVKLNGQTLKTSNGNPQYYTIQDGNIDITLPEMTYKHDTYQIEVVTGQRNAFTGARNNTTLTINTKNVKTATITNKQLVNIIPQKQIALTGETNTINIKIQDANNKAIKKGSVTFTQNGKTLSTSKITNGIAYLNHKYNTPGTYTIIATYTDSTNTYTTTQKQFTITIKEQTKNTTKITANNTITTVGETLTYTTLFTDQHNNKIQTGTAKITIQNKTITSNITNGLAITTYTFNKTGKYQITITCNDAKITRTITVTKQNPTIKINKPHITAGQNNTITATITTKTQVPLNEGKIQWKINGITIKNTKAQTIQTTIKDGTSTLTYNIPSTWAGKQINITSIYTGSANYNIKATTTNITIPQLQAKATITITPTTPQTQDNTTIKITIKDKNTDKTITTNDKIAVKINGKTITTPRLKNGSTTIQYKLPLLKTNRTHNITVVYGNKNYKRLDANKQFNIKRINTTITLKDTRIKKGQTLHIKTYIKDTHGEIMQRNDTYCIKLNQKTIHTGKLNNGLIDFKLPINYKTRTYTLTIKTGNNYYYNGITKDLQLTVI